MSETAMVYSGQAYGRNEHGELILLGEVDGKVSWEEPGPSIIEGQLVAHDANTQAALIKRASGYSWIEVVGFTPEPIKRVRLQRVQLTANAPTSRLFETSALSITIDTYDGVPQEPSYDQVTVDLIDLEYGERWSRYWSMNPWRAIVERLEDDDKTHLHLGDVLKSQVTMHEWGRGSSKSRAQGQRVVTSPRIVLEPIEDEELSLRKAFRHANALSQLVGLVSRHALSSWRLERVHVEADSRRRRTTCIKINDTLPPRAYHRDICREPFTANFVEQAYKTYSKDMDFWFDVLELFFWAQRMPTHSSRFLSTYLVLEALVARHVLDHKLKYWVGRTKVKDEVEREVKAFLKETLQKRDLPEVPSGKTNDLFRVSAKQLQKKMFEELGVHWEDANALRGKPFWWVNVRNKLVHEGGGVSFEDLAQAEVVLLSLVGRCLLRNFGFETNSSLHPVDADIFDIGPTEYYQIFDDHLANVFPVNELRRPSKSASIRNLCISSKDPDWDGLHVDVSKAILHYSHPGEWMLRVDMNLHAQGSSVPQRSATLSVVVPDEFADEEQIKMFLFIDDYDEQGERLIATRKTQKKSLTWTEFSLDEFIMTGYAEFIVYGQRGSKSTIEEDEPKGPHIEIDFNFRR